SPKSDGLPRDCMNTVTQCLRHGFQAIEPLCGFTDVPSVAETNDSCGLRTSHFAESCHASKVAGHRSVGRGLPKSTHSFPVESFQKAGWPSGTGGGFGVFFDLVQSRRNCSKFEVVSFQTQSPH